ncbi:MAG TPA: hypothetical protein VHY35_12660 [Stellaceae bacterium]|nr:hypothetical protein [Stellaceae bacterium]
MTDKSRNPKTPDDDPFALGGAQPEELTPAEQALIDGIRRLMPNYRFELSYLANRGLEPKGRDYVTIFGSPDLGNQTVRGGDRRSIEYHLALRAEAVPEPPPHCDIPALRQRVAAMVEEFGTPLPDGEAGIFEAARRMRLLDEWSSSVVREFDVSMETEKTEIDPYFDPITMPSKSAN